MATRNDILTELQELNSSLGETSYRNATYQVPSGYFDGLADEVLKKIKALESGTPKEELSLLSPLLSSIKKEMPFAVPEGYFGAIGKKIEEVISSEITQDPQKELQDLSPLLSSIKNKNTYTVPAGYFENLQPAIHRKIEEPAAKVISLTRLKWVRYAAAAIVIGIVVTFGFLNRSSKQEIDPSTKSYAWVQRNLKKVSTEDIAEFVESTNTETTDMAKTNAKDEISSLLKDVSDKEIQDFLNDTQTTETGSDDTDLILN